MTPAQRDNERQVVALLPRTSDVSTSTMTGARALGELLGARLVGTAGTGRRADFEDDLRESRGVLLEAGGQVDDAFAAGRMPVLLAGSCSIAVSTLPVVARARPGTRVVWLDAHGDFNTPETTGSRFLGGMCLSGPCGLWDTGFGAGIDPTGVALFGVRDLDDREQDLLISSGVGLHDRVGDLADALDGDQVYLHLDLDILSDDVLPADFPADGGLDFEGLARVLDQLAGATDIIGAEVVGAHPDYAQDIAEAIAPLL